MDRVIAARVFVEKVERGSAAAAANALGMSRAMASRYLAAPEAARLGPVPEKPLG